MKHISLTAIAVVGLMGIGACAAPTAKNSPPTPITSATSIPDVTQDDPEPDLEPAEPETTLSQDNALGAAESYLEYQAFSKSGLIKQLKYEKYSTADATWAANHVDADWNEQAEKSGRNYLENQSFSRASLVTQLKYEGFTTAQATYAVKQIGL